MPSNKMIGGDSFVASIRAAAPYVHTHHGKVFVLQLEGSIICNNRSAQDLFHDVALLNSLGIRLVLVYGVCAQDTETIQKQVADPPHTDALRITDADAMQRIKEVVGTSLININALLSTGLPNSPMAGSELKVTVGNYVLAKPTGIKAGVDLKWTGAVRYIDIDTIKARLNNNEIVLIPPLGYSLAGEIFNLNPIEVAAQCAIELSADKLIFISSGRQLIDAEGAPIRQITKKEAYALLTEGHLDSGDKIYLNSGISACESGVDRVHFINQKIEGALLKELFSRDGIGTLLSVSSFDEIRQASIEDIGGILELIAPLEEEGVLVRRSREKLEEQIDDYSIISRDGAVIACSALHINKNEGLGEIACLVVATAYRKQKWATQLLTYLEKIAIANEVDRIFSLTTHAMHWFFERGFILASIDDLPLEKKRLYNYQRNAKVLIKKIGTK